MIGRILVFVFLFGLLCVSAAAKPPNIVLLFADDMGWSDMGYRNDEFESPNLDKLARESLDFQQAYIACPTCSPSRATLLTGQHPARLELVRHIPTGPKHPDFDEFGRTDVEFNQWETDPAQVPCRNWLPLEHTTYAEALSELGYYNLFVGKWHLGHEKYHPIAQGFDHQIGTSNWGHPKSYHPPYFKNSDALAEEENRYLTDKLTDETVKFINGYDKHQPFMVSLWYYTVHGPHDGREDLVRYFESKGLTGRRTHYVAMVKSLDESIGRIRRALTEKGIDRETIVIFLSDQGSYFDNPPFRGGKRVDTLYEGGARVPFLFHWPSVTKPGTKSNVPVQSTDLFPTLVEIAGGSPTNYKNLDGTSLVPVIKGNAPPDRDALFGYRAYEDLYASVRSGDYKLLAYRSGKVKMYNVAKDTGEQTDLSETQPDRVRFLVEKLIAWEKEMGVEKYSGVQ